MVFHPETEEMYVQRIEPDKNLWEQVMVPRLTEFYYKYVVPELNAATVQLIQSRVLNRKLKFVS